MNVMVYKLESRTLEAKNCSQKIKIEDNVGESIHIHLRNTRLELSIEDFEVFAEKIIKAKEIVENGHR